MSVKKFTLFELLVVVAVIAILISILMPSLVLARESAIRKLCMSNLKDIGLHTFQFMVDKNGMTPRHNMVFKHKNPKTWSGRWYTQLQPYSQAEDPYIYSGYRCPSKDNKEKDGYSKPMYGIAKAISCQDKPPGELWIRSWGWYRLDFAVSTSENVIFAESEKAAFAWRRYGGLDILGPGPSFKQFGYAGDIRHDGIDHQHGGVVNQLFADGRVLSLKAKSINNTSAFRKYAEKHYYPPQDYRVKPSSPPPGMVWKK